MSTPQVHFSFHVDSYDVIHAYCLEGKFAKKYMFSKQEVEEAHKDLPLDQAVHKVAMFYFRRDVDIWHDTGPAGC